MHSANVGAHNSNIPGLLKELGLLIDFRFPIRSCVKVSAVRP